MNLVRRNQFGVDRGSQFGPQRARVLAGLVSRFQKTVPLAKDVLNTGGVLIVE